MKKFVRESYPLVIGIIALLAVGKNCDAQNKRQPNVIFILADDLGWTDLTSYGSKFYETPNLDKLASEGVKFTNAYAACPVSSPTRSSIMTGKYPISLANTDWFGAIQPYQVDNRYKKPLLPAPYRDYLPLEEVTIAEALKNNGYKTCIAGKWHLGEEEKYWPEHQGFDKNYGGFNMGHPPKTDKYNGYFSPYGNPRLEDGPIGEYLPERLTNESLRFIEENKDKPFFLYRAFYLVHTPLQGLKKDIEKYEAKKIKLGLKDSIVNEGVCKVRYNQCLPVYAAMVEALDREVGRIIQKLKELNLDKNTIIIFTSDNGGLSTAEGSPTSNFPLKAGKGWLYEGGIREPLIISYAGLKNAGKVINEPVISTDFYPTILQMLGLKLMPKQHTGGVSFLPLLKGEKFKHGPLFWHYPHYGNQGGQPSAAVRLDDWKLIEFFEDNHVELYNLKDDIGEKVNLAVRNREKSDQLKKILHQWQKDNGARFPLPNPIFKK